MNNGEAAANFCYNPKPKMESFLEPIMEYAVGKTGRVIVARLSEGEELYASIKEIAKKENVKAAAVFITGGFRKADVVVGPAVEEPKIIAQHRDFIGPGEVLGVGTIYWDEQGPSMHIHTAIGKDGEVMVGCPRGGANTFLILEITIIEITGIDAKRVLDEKSGFKLLKLG